MLLMKGSVFNSNAVPHLCACALLIEQCAEVSFAALCAGWLAAVHALTPACLPSRTAAQHVHLGEFRRTMQRGVMQLCSSAGHSS